MAGTQRRFFKGIEWRWSLLNLAWGAPTVIASFALPAWAVQAANLFAEFSPFSWVVAGFGGLVTFAVSASLIAWVRGRWITARYNAKLIRASGFIDPIASTFEGKRIALGDFVLPAHPVVENKTFINCDIIGPAILLMDYGNSVRDLAYPTCDAILIPTDVTPSNVIICRNCTFRHCRFVRITFAIRELEYGAFRNDYLKYITATPDRTLNLPFSRGSTINIDEDLNS
jgi:hypothetical protein